MRNSSIFAMVTSDLALVEAELLSVIQTPVEMLTDISAHLTKAGGKRLRPALYLLCAKQGYTSDSNTISVAAAIELIHMATLVHDDVIDSAATRRGIATANAQWGNHASVLSGDFLFAKAFSIVASKGSNEILRILADVISSMCEGEIVQIKESFNPDQQEAAYYDRIAKKTADFIAGSARIGAIMAGMSKQDIQALHDYGYSLGMAFQITDDILDFTSSVEQLGKPAGNDLRQGIITLPIIHALRDPVAGRQLREIIVRQRMDEADIKQGLAIVHNAGSIEYSYKQVARYLQQARNVLPQSLDVAVRSALLEVADFVGKRNY